ncbi:Predicted flavoprotein CzcO associated with the cation diffusion facilitator CzcD [Geodermatophilus telluris]|uniref:Predicted flavoprotein CzcO associated with the cation diffusion facilitator CzcD n=1 Tax=Geodermatophilus telluris TaxID=1190417 RepID=A0A1G6MBC5_9ACTN|nr:NAD(P)/FAD-dependent oxidoreductase [Geodermatophilus telluris]SDC52627.1 Predicted flavoprotein CzcO associated with the cation diffusion facilitator CzcD [Geodermatophilus telluris]
MTLTTTPRHATATGPLPEHVRVAVVGSGFSGIGTAVALLRAGVDDFVVLERAAGLGGTWRDNDYPGAAVDVPSHLYSFSFALKRDWSHVYSRQPEIQRYLEQVAADHGVLPHLYCDTDVVSGRWDDDALVWRLQTSRGDLTVDVVVSGAGGLVEPHLPDVPGTETFQGPSFHSARWDHSVDLAGKRVAVVGTGASAAQFVPELQRTAAEVVVFQRTPPWVLPRRDRAYSEREHRLQARVPGLLRLARGGQYVVREARLGVWTGAGRLRRLFEGQALGFLEQQVPDPELRARLTPDYALGCKRVVVSDDYLASLAQPNVEVVAAPVTAVRPHAVVAADGTEHEVDVIVWGTGFRVMDIPLGHRLVGREGRTLREEWDRSGVQAHRGTTVAGFPNLFLLLGPNTALGHTSVVIMIEAQIGYVVEALRRVEEAGAGAIEVRRSAQDAYNARLQEELTGTVWNAGGCRSWYRDEQGRNFTLWPTRTSVFLRLMRRFDADSYELRSPRRVPVPVAVPA